MIISFEGLPGCRKDEIYQRLKQLGIEVKSAQNPELLELFWQQPERYALTYQLDQLIRHGEIINQNQSTRLYVDSFYALKEVYMEYLMSQKILERPEVEVFHRLHYLLKIQPDAVIYFYGDLDKCHQRSLSEGGPRKWSLEEFRGLYAQYEWVFDGNNCFLKIFKINIEDDINLVMKVLLKIFDQIQNRWISSEEGTGIPGVPGVPPGFDEIKSDSNESSG